MGDSEASILLLAPSADDPQARAIAASLEARSASYLLIPIHDPETHIHCRFDPDAEPSRRSRVSIIHKGRPMRVTSSTAVWYQTHREHIEPVVAGLGVVREMPWINHPAAAAAARDPLTQMSLATEVGLRTPASLVTSEARMGRRLNGIALYVVQDETPVSQTIEVFIVGRRLFTPSATLESEVARGLLRLVHRMELTTAGIKLTEDGHGRLQFHSLDPDYNWWPLQEGGVPVSDAMALELVQGAALH